MSAADIAQTASERIAGPRELNDPPARDEFVAFVILLFAAADLHSWIGDWSLASFLLRVSWVLLYLAVAGRLVQRFGMEWLTWTIRQQPALCTLLTLALVSFVWSLDPRSSLWKAISLFGTTALGVFIGYTCPPHALMRALRWTFAVLIVGSIAVAMFSSAPAGNQPLGWRGIMDYKNAFGAAAALSTIFFLVVTLNGSLHPFWGFALSILSAFAAAKSHSRTSLVALSFTLAASAYLVIASITRGTGRAMSCRMALALVLSVSIPPLLIAPLWPVAGSQDPLNSRPLIWAGALTILRERPLTGYGYAAVWGRSNATLLPHIGVTARPFAWNAHNSVVDVASELGVPAAVIACVYLFGALRNAGLLFERAPSAFSAFALAFVFAMTVIGFAEAHLLRIHSMFWILFVALTVAVRRALMRDADEMKAAPTLSRCGD